ncbi:MAG: radical SAM protein, partial [Stenotrophomonas sp.]
MITAGPHSMQLSATPLAAPVRWQQRWREAIRDPRELLRQLGLDPLELGVSDAAAGQFAVRVPHGFAARMRHGDRHDPLLRQVLPITDELKVVPGFSLDAVGDGAAKKATGVIQKYRGRALLVTTGSCAINCRYCFRRHFDYGSENAAREGWRDAVDAIAQDPDIDEVILSGGDPLSLATHKLVELTQALRQIPHLRRLRIHSRLPVVLPERVDDELVQWLASLPWPVAFVIHA